MNDMDFETALKNALKDIKRRKTNLSLSAN